MGYGYYMVPVLYRVVAIRYFDHPREVVYISSSRLFEALSHA